MQYHILHYGSTLIINKVILVKNIQNPNGHYIILINYVLTFNIIKYEFVRSYSLYH